MNLQWQWSGADPTNLTFGNSNQWTVSAGLQALARESAQNSNDARVAEQATLVYEFIRLTGDERARFERAIGYEEQLSPHLQSMGEDADAAVAARQIRAGVKALAESEALVLLRISDYGCRGLTGPDLPGFETRRDSWGNLIKLCRLDLFSGKDDAAGGSYGLGKAVYWRYSRIQTALFSSNLDQADAIDGNESGRVLGVSQGVPHTYDGKLHVGRGFFGVPDSNGYPVAAWAADKLDGLQLGRDDDRPGTTALVVGFFDPDSPEGGATLDGLQAQAEDLRAGIEESFWPLLTRGRLQVIIRVQDNDRVHFSADVAPEVNFTDLVQALERYDGGRLDEALEETYSTVVRDIPIVIPERIGDDPHPQFTHMAKLVVTVSDDQTDSLENRVCLLRHPEMVVETIDRTFEGKTYHAFLLAGRAVDPSSDDERSRQADNFLRLAEPPAHDQWIPRSGRSQASQANLTTDTYRPWGPSLRGIRAAVEDALKDLFDIAPTPDERGPQSIINHLRFLTDAGLGPSAGSSALGKPAIDLTDWKVVDGRWAVTFTVTARNLGDGWLLRPDLKVLGLDGRGVVIPWESMHSETGGVQVLDGEVRIPGKQRGRRLEAVVSAVSVDELPVPANESVIDVVVGRHEKVEGQPETSNAEVVQ